MKVTCYPRTFYISFAISYATVRDQTFHRLLQNAKMNIFDNPIELWKHSIYQTKYKSRIM